MKQMNSDMIEIGQINGRVSAFLQKAGKQENPKKQTEMSVWISQANSLLDIKNTFDEFRRWVPNDNCIEILILKFLNLHDVNPQDRIDLVFYVLNEIFSNDYLKSEVNYRRILFNIISSDLPHVDLLLKVLDTAVEKRLVTSETFTVLLNNLIHENIKVTDEILGEIVLEPARREKLITTKIYNLVLELANSDSFAINVFEDAHINKRANPLTYINAMYVLSQQETPNPFFLRDILHNTRELDRGLEFNKYALHAISKCKEHHFEEYVVKIFEFLNKFEGKLDIEILLDAFQSIANYGAATNLHELAQKLNFLNKYYKSDESDESDESVKIAFNDVLRVIAQRDRTDVRLARLIIKIAEFKKINVIPLRRHFLKCFLGGMESSLSIDEESIDGLSELIDDFQTIKPRLEKYQKASDADGRIINFHELGYGEVYFLVKRLSKLLIIIEDEKRKPKAKGVPIINPSNSVQVQFCVGSQSHTHKSHLDKEEHSPVISALRRVVSEIGYEKSIYAMPNSWVTFSTLPNVSPSASVALEKVGVFSSGAAAAAAAVGVSRLGLGEDAESLVSLN